MISIFSWSSWSASVTHTYSIDCYLKVRALVFTLDLVEFDTDIISVKPTLVLSSVDLEPSRLGTSSEFEQLMSS